MLSRNQEQMHCWVNAFIVATIATRSYHDFLNLIASEINAVVVSVDYRTAPEHPIPACFNDSWEAIKWVTQHATGNGPESWLNEYPDFGNISHHMAIRIGFENPGICVILQGIILLHPNFLEKGRVGLVSDHSSAAWINDMWVFAHPETSGLDGPLINPAKDRKVSDLGCSRVLVYVAEKDVLRDRGW
ncbi:hypothetical protein R6Q57_008737 [Mikania cordata]